MEINKNIVLPETVELLTSFGISKNAIRMAQYTYIKEAVLEKINTLYNHIKKDKYEEAFEMFAISPAGDDMGCENQFLNCKDILQGDDDIDLAEVIGRLFHLLHKNEQEPEND